MPLIKGSRGLLVICARGMEGGGGGQRPHQLHGALGSVRAPSAVRRQIQNLFHHDIYYLNYTMSFICCPFVYTDNKRETLFPSKVLLCSLWGISIHLVTSSYTKSEGRYAVSTKCILPAGGFTSSRVRKRRLMSF